MAFFISEFDTRETTMYEVIWHGRGGQGVVIAAQILAESAYLQGFKGVTSAPTFGPERRGAPLTASTRISDTPIRTFSQIEKADIAVVLDPSLFGIVDILGSLKPEGLLIINTAAEGGRGRHPRDASAIATVDAAAIALRFHLLKEGAPMVNTPMLGVFSQGLGPRLPRTPGEGAEVEALRRGGGDEHRGAPGRLRRNEHQENG